MYVCTHVCAYVFSIRVGNVAIGLFGCIYVDEAGRDTASRMFCVQGKSHALRLDL